MKKWSTSTRVTILLVVLLLVFAIGRSMWYGRLAHTVAHQVATPEAVQAARKLILHRKLARVFKDRTDQAKKQAIRTAQILAADRETVEIEDHHMSMAQASAAAIVEFLSDLELPVRAAAADALGRMGKPAARPLIDIALASPDKDVRTNATLALTQIGDVAVPELIDVIKGGSPSQKVGAAGAVGRLHSPRAIDALVGALAAKEKEVRLACRDALVVLGEPSVEPLIGALTNADAFTRQHAAEALGELGNAAAAEPLLPAMEDDNRLVRLAATYAVGKVGQPSATPLLVAKLADRDREIREAAAVSLGQIGDPAAVQPLVAALNDPVDKVRTQAAMALGRLGPAAAAAMGGIAAAAQAADEGTREAAVLALGQIGNTGAVPTVAARLNPAAEPSVPVRRQAAQALGRLGSPSAIPALLGAFADPDWRVNYMAQEALAGIGQPALPQLLGLMSSQDSLQARYARKALVKMQPAPVAELARFLGGTPDQRLNATLALGEIGNPEARALLQPLAAGDPDPRVKAAAAHALAAGPSAEPVLNPVAPEPAPAAAQPAEEAAPAAAPTE
jgi:HEAT repeat protein